MVAGVVVMAIKETGQTGMTAAQILLAVKGRLLPYLVVIVIDILYCVRRQPTGGRLCLLPG